MWIPSFQASSLNSRLVANFTKTAQNNVNSLTATKKSLAPQFSQSETVKNHTALSTEEVRVDMAEMKVVDRPVTLITNVGSCVAICIHDSINKCGGLAHIMLPTSKVSRNKSFPLKYADTAVPALTEALRKMGKNKNGGLSAKMAGGANMFPNIKSTTLNIGKNNVEAVRQALAMEGIRLLAEDVGGNHGRRVSFNVTDGSVHIRNGRREIKTI